MLVFLICAIYTRHYSSKDIDGSVTTEIKRDVKVIITDNESRSFLKISKLFKSHKFKKFHGTLVNFNSHFNGFFNTNISSFNDYRLISVERALYLSYIKKYFDRMFWIYPEWMGNNHLNKEFSFNIGKFANGFCLCKNDSKCADISPFESHNTSQVNCTQLLRSLNMSVYQDSFVQFSQPSKSFSDPLTLRINLDYFSYQRASSLPSVSQMSSSTLFQSYSHLFGQLEELLNRMFCVKHESSIDLIRYFLHQSLLNNSQIDSEYDGFLLNQKLLCNEDNKSTEEQFIKTINHLKSVTVKLRYSLPINICQYLASKPSKRSNFIYMPLCIGDGISNFDNYEGTFKSRRNFSIHQYSNRTHKYGKSKPIFHSHIHHPGKKAEFLLNIRKLVKICSKLFPEPNFVIIIKNSRHVKNSNSDFIMEKLLENLSNIYAFNSTSIIYH